MTTFYDKLNSALSTAANYDTIAEAVATLLSELGVGPEVGGLLFEHGFDVGTVIAEDDATRKGGVRPKTPSEIRAMAAIHRQAADASEVEARNQERADLERSGRVADDAMSGDSGKRIGKMKTALIRGLMSVPAAARADHAKSAISTLLGAINKIAKAHDEGNPRADKMRLTMKPKLAPHRTGKPVRTEAISSAYARMLLVLLEDDTQASNIVHELVANRVDPYTSSLVIKSVIKDILKATGLKASWKVPGADGKTDARSAIGWYVDKAIKNQTGRRDMSVVINSGGNSGQAILKAYIDALTKRGYVVRKQKIGDKTELIFNKPEMVPDDADASGDGEKTTEYSEPTLKVVGHLKENGKDRPDLKIAIANDRIFLSINNQWHKLDRKSWTELQDKGIGPWTLARSKRTDQHSRPKKTGQRDHFKMHRSA